MAVAWDINITVTNLAERRLRIQATRADNADPNNPRTFSVDGIYDTVNKTPQQLLTEYTDLLWGKYQAEVTIETNHAALIGQAETALRNALEATE